MRFGVALMKDLFQCAKAFLDGLAGNFTVTASASATATATAVSCNQVNWQLLSCFHLFDLSHEWLSHGSGNKRQLQPGGCQHIAPGAYHT